MFSVSTFFSHDRQIIQGCNIVIKILFADYLTRLSAGSQLDDHSAMNLRYCFPVEKPFVNFDSSVPRPGYLSVDSVDRDTGDSLTYPFSLTSVVDGTLLLIDAVHLSVVHPLSITADSEGSNAEGGGQVNQQGYFSNYLVPWEMLPGKCWNRQLSVNIANLCSEFVYIDFIGLF